MAGLELGQDRFTCSLYKEKAGEAGRPAESVREELRPCGYVFTHTGTELVNEWSLRVNS